MPCGTGCQSVTVNVSRDYLNITIQLVSEHSNEELERLIQLPTYKALYSEKIAGVLTTRRAFGSFVAV